MTRLALAEQDILEKKFTAVDGRYDAGDVDAYLQQVAASVRELTEQLTTASAVPAEDEPAAAATLLSMARQLHDEHISEAKRQARDIVTDAKQTGTRLVTDAQTRADQVLGDLEASKVALEVKVDELRTFEADFREQLKAKLHGFLQHVNGA